MLGTNCRFRNMRELELHLIRNKGYSALSTLRRESWLPFMDPINQLSLFVLAQKAAFYSPYPGKYHEFQHVPCTNACH